MLRVCAYETRTKGMTPSMFFEVIRVSTASHPKDSLHITFFLLFLLLLLSTFFFEYAFLPSIPICFFFYFLFRDFCKRRLHCAQSGGCNGVFFFPGRPEAALQVCFQLPRLFFLNHLLFPFGFFSSSFCWPGHQPTQDEKSVRILINFDDEEVALFGVLCLWLCVFSCALYHSRLGW